MYSHFRNQIYYLYDLHNQCFYVMKYSEKIINKYIKYVNIKLNQYFTKEEQIQLKLYNFDINLMHEFAFTNIPEGISFDNIDKIKLFKFFDDVCNPLVDEIELFE